jgi:hypothetical protein
VIARYLLAWLLLAVVAVVNGILRQAAYATFLPELTAHQVSTATGILATGFVVWLIQRRWPIESASQAWTIGACWLSMTVVFEFGFGHYIAAHPWSALLADYNILHGRVWSLFLIWVTTMPYLFFRLSRNLHR